jgi:hypothetical protein
MKSRRRSAHRHWTSPKPRPAASADGNAATRPSAEPRHVADVRAQGPYEASYDISLGYGMERQIVRP